MLLRFRLRSRHACHAADAADAMFFDAAAAAMMPRCRRFSRLVDSLPLFAMIKRYTYMPMLDDTITPPLRYAAAAMPLH